MKKYIKLVLGVAGVTLLLAGCGAKDKTNDQIASTSDENTEISISGDSDMSGSNDASYTDYGMKDFDPDKLSEKYIIGIAGYPSYGDYYECLGYSYIVTYEKELIYRIGDDEAGRFTIDDATFDDFIGKLDFYDIATTKIYVPDPDNICDGGSDYIYLYDKDENVYVTRGGYCVESEKFWEYFKLVHGLVDNEWQSECYNEYMASRENLIIDNEAVLLNAIPELQNTDMLAQQLSSVDGGYRCGKIISVSEPFIEDENYFSVIITDENDNRFKLVLGVLEIQKMIVRMRIEVTEEYREETDRPITCDMIQELRK